MKHRNRLLALALAFVMSFTLAGCTINLSKDSGSTPLTRAEAATDTITLPEGMDASSKFTVQKADSSMYIVFNGINKRETGYFSVPSGSMTILGSGTGEAAGMKSFKINVWKQVEGGTQYVADSTIYYYTDGSTYTYTLSGLDLASNYRLTISYDAYGYYIYGMMRVDGVGDVGAAPEQQTDESASVAAA